MRKIKIMLLKTPKILRSEFKTGVYNDLAESVYRADSALSTSDLKLIDNPNEFHGKITGQAPRVDSASMAFGRMCHSYILERDQFDALHSVCPPDKQDKRLKVNKEWWKEQEASGKLIIKQDDYDRAMAISDRFYSLPIVRDIKFFNSEVSVFAQKFHGSVDAKCRIDMLAGSTVIDLKTTRKGGARPLEFKRTARNLKYAWQEVNYRNIAAKAGLKIDKWYWAVVETEWPYNSCIVEFTDNDRQVAQEQLDEAYSTLESCMRLSVWPDYTPHEPLVLNVYDRL